MNREQIILMAREAGCVGPETGGDPYGLWEPQGEENVTELMFRFAALVAAAEREACAKHFDDGDYMMYRSEVAAAIRARKQQ